MNSPSIPEATVPLLQTKYCGICSASASKSKLGFDFCRWHVVHLLLDTIVVPVRKGWIFPVQLGKHTKHLIFIIKKHNRSCQDIFLRKHCKRKRRSWKLVVSNRCLHSKCCKSRQPAMSTTLVIPGPARSNLVLVVILGVGSKGPYWDRRGRRGKGGRRSGIWCGWGADSSLADDAGPDGSSEAEMLFTVLRGMWTKPSKKQTENTKKSSRNRQQRWRTARREEKRRRKWRTEPSMKGKLNAPRNHMIDVRSHRACASQRRLT